MLGSLTQLPAGMQFPLTISFVDFLAISPSQTTGGSLSPLRLPCGARPCVAEHR
jgi:hypothetical protein